MRPFFDVAPAIEHEGWPGEEEMLRGETVGSLFELELPQDEQELCPFVVDESTKWGESSFSNVHSKKKRDGAFASQPPDPSDAPKEMQAVAPAAAVVVLDRISVSLRRR
jgi:hypothetical protein